MTKTIYRFTRVTNDPTRMQQYPSISWKFTLLENGQLQVSATVCNSDTCTFSKKVGKNILDGMSIHSGLISFTVPYDSQLGLVRQAMDGVNSATDIREFQTVAARYREIQQAIYHIYAKQSLEQMQRDAMKLYCTQTTQRRAA